MQYIIGEIVEGIVTGIKPYGAFVSLDETHSGLIHISEISSGFVKDVSSFVHIGESVKVKIIDIDEGVSQFKLSLKALKKQSVRKNRKKYYIPHKDRLPSMKLGFKPLKDNLNRWIKEANH